MAYKQNFKSPILKALVGKQHNLPQHLQDAIKAAPESPAKLEDPRAGKKGPKQTPEARKKMIKKMNKAYDKVSKPSTKPGPKVTPQERKAIAEKMLKKYEGGPKSPAKLKKGDKYKGGARKTDAQMADRTRRVDEGLTVRRKDYAPGKDGQAAFNADRRASFDNRRAKHASVRTRLKSGEITPQEANRERSAYAKDIYKSRSTKKSRADRDKGDAPTTYIVSRKGIKRKVSDAEKASYESVAKMATDPTKPKTKGTLKRKVTKKTPNYNGKITNIEKRKDKPGYTVTTTGRVDPKVVREATKTGKAPSRKKTQQKAKKQGPPTSVNGKVIKY